MTNKPADPGKPGYVERRSGVDRRKVDMGSPFNYERRRRIEPRKPEVVERPMSDTEWAELAPPDPKPPK